MFLPILFAILLTCYLYKRIRHMTALKRNGILGPKPNLITGNFFSHLSKPNVLKASEYAQDYGKISGYYFGRDIFVNVLDLDLIKEVQVKNFSLFSTKDQLGFYPGAYRNIADFTGENLVLMGDAKWKETRSILSSAFTPAKIKSMTPTMSSSADIFMDKMDGLARGGKEFDVYGHLQGFTTDVMSKVTMGVDDNLQHNPQHHAYQAASRLFDAEPSRLILGLNMFSDFDYAMKPVRKGIQSIREYLGYDDGVKLASYVGTVLDNRMANAGKQPPRDDLMQTMIDSGKMPRGEVLSHESYFYKAAFKTESTALAFAAHFLVNFPEVQERVRTEIQEVFQAGGKFDYDTMSKLTYTQCVLYETLRYYPVFTNFVTRSAKTDFAYKDMVLPKGATISIPVPQLHHTEEYWPKHNVFDPERFLDKSNMTSPAFQGFGGGPRTCLGIRFAMFEMKLILARLLSKYRLVPGESTEKELTIAYGDQVQTPANGVWLKAVPVEA